MPTVADLAPEAISNCDPDGTQNSGAVYRICMPPNWWWNGDLVIFAHGYVAYNQPVGIPEDQLCLPDDGLCLPDIINTLGYGFATTSYSVNGLAIKEGLADVVDLVDIFSQQYGRPDRVFLTGASEGGLVTVLAVEQYPQVFDGGLATCGPIGDFNRQISYFGDFRVLFDYFFPGLIEGSPVEIPQPIIDNWETIYEGNIRPVVFDPANQETLRQLIRVSGAPYDPDDMMASTEESVADVLWYNVFATNDARVKLTGQPFGNRLRWYRGSDNDFRLNRRVQRFVAEPSAVAEIEAFYQTTGELEVPLVTLHTTRDQQVPYFHELLYRWKTLVAGSGLRHINLPVERYGHCNFTIAETLAAFGLLVLRASGEPLNAEAVDKLLPDPKEKANFEALLETYSDPSREDW
jgi:pimeloyl-ACP methyl ester carboxylesterase